MHKCFKCGVEFEGKYCPECGTQWQEEKSCPQCGAKLAGNAKFCNECGYSFVESTVKSEKQPNKVSVFFVKMWAWIKSHLKIVIPTACGMVVLIVMLSLIPTFIVASVNGTYYKLVGGQFIENDYVTLSTGKWVDGETKGSYSLKSGKIQFRTEELDDIFGDELSVREGEIENGVIKFKDQGFTEIYCKKSHAHKYSEWETVYNPTCASTGLKRHKCFCETWESEQIAATGIHTVENGVCSVCEQLQLVYALNEDGKGYTVTGFSAGFDNSETVEIWNTYNNLPVSNIADGAFSGCNKLTSVTIGESIKSIGRNVFENCSNLLSVTFKNVKNWQISLTDDAAKKGTAVDVSDPVKVAEYFTGDYGNYYWNKWYIEKLFDEFIEVMVTERSYRYLVTHEGKTDTYDVDGDTVRFREDGDRRGEYWYSEGGSFYHLKYGDDSKYHKTYSDEVVADEIILNKLKLATITDYNDKTREYTAIIDGKTYLMILNNSELRFYDEGKVNVYVVNSLGDTKNNIPTGISVVDETTK